MPSVRAGESRKDYLKRAIPYIINKEGLSRNAAVGKAEGLYNSYLKKKRKRKS